ncbi:MAG: 5'-deoxynucleotidase [Oscillospiraceae bacterium]
MDSSFFALILRMKHINRWGLMRNTFSDNLAEHSLDTSIIVHCLCVIGNTYFEKNLNAERAALLALYHDACEIITGDMPTPIKYYSENLRRLYRDIETEAAEQLVGKLPPEMQETYRGIFACEGEDAVFLPYLKGADKLSALIKCIQEEQSGNHEFSKALQCQIDAIHALNLPEAAYFMEHFIPAFQKSLDEQ